MTSYEVAQWLPVKEEDVVVLEGTIDQAMQKKVRDAFAAGKRVFFWCQNPYGLKYFAGALWEKDAPCYASIENGAFAGRRDIEDILEDAGLSAKFYYPYPDVSDMQYLFTDERGPGADDFLRDAKRCYDRDLQLFHEGNTAIALERQGVYGALANSFLVELYEDEPLPAVYVKLSDRRREGYRIRTELRKDAVIKSPLSEAAKDHLGHMADMSRFLQDACGGEKKGKVDGPYYQVSPVLEKGEDGSLTFPLHQGKTLDAVIDARLRQGNLSGAVEMLSAFLEDVRGFQTQAFAVTEEFRSVFLKESAVLENALKDIYPDGTDSLTCTDIDLAPSNIILSKQGASEVRTIIDYEWTYDFPIPLDFLCYRILREYIGAKDLRRQLIEEDEGEFYAGFGIDEKMRAAFDAMEQIFQDGITAGGEEGEKKERRLPDLSLEVYYDYGEGFSEEHKDCLGLYGECGEAVSIMLKEGVKALRIDPAKCPGILRVLSILDEHRAGCAYRTNMKKIGSKTFYCSTDDPWIVVRLHKGQKEVRIAYEYDGILK